MRTFKHGGVHPPENKLTKDSPIETMGVPKSLVVPLLQHIGKPAKPIVNLRDVVKKGQVIGESDGFVSAVVHAPTSGTVKSIASHPTPSGQYATCITIESDGKDEWLEGVNEEVDYTTLDKKDIVKKIQDAGVVGMGGAGFPTHVKLSPPTKIEYVILNAAECEPFLTSDHRVMIESPDEVLKGLKIISSIFDSKPKVFIGIESNKPDAIEVMKKLSLQYDFEVAPLQTKYPQGSEKQLIQALTGRSVPEGKLPFDVGCLVQNVATSVAVFQAVSRNKPLIERVLTVSGMEITTKKNIKALIGTRFEEIVEFCDGIRSEDLNQVICGGPMMGKAQYTLDVPVTKTTSGILFIVNKELDKLKEKPCIRCGKCVQVCPQGERPWVLVDNAQKHHVEDLPSYGLNECMECGSCAYVCPSKREIVHWIKYSKAININLKRRKQADK